MSNDDRDISKAIDSTSIFVIGGSSDELLEFHNDGPVLRSTNYWGSEMEKRGLFFVSVNSRTFRLLVPRSQESVLPEIASGRYAILTFGLTTLTFQDALELLFEDDSDSPLMLRVGPKQVAPWVGPENQTEECVLSVYRYPLEEVLRMKCFLRRGSIPCLQRLNSKMRKSNRTTALLVNKLTNKGNCNE